MMDHLFLGVLHRWHQRRRAQLMFPHLLQRQSSGPGTYPLPPVSGRPIGGGCCCWDSAGLGSLQRLQRSRKSKFKKEHLTQFHSLWKRMGGLRVGRSLDLERDRYLSFLFLSSWVRLSAQSMMDWRQLSCDLMIPEMRWTTLTWGGSEGGGCCCGWKPSGGCMLPLSVWGWGGQGSWCMGGRMSQWGMPGGRGGFIIIGAFCSEGSRQPAYRLSQGQLLGFCGGGGGGAYSQG